MNVGARDEAYKHGPLVVVKYPRTSMVLFNLSSLQKHKHPIPLLFDVKLVNTLREALERAWRAFKEAIARGWRAYCEASKNMMYFNR